MHAISRSARADEDLIAIWRSIAVHDLATADRVLDAIDERIRQLSAFPLLGVAREDLAPSLRHLRSGPYLIFYRPGETVVEIVRVLDGRRKLDELLR